MYVNSKAKEQSTFDAIVVGSGISGGWAAKELCEGGMKTLLLDRGRDVKHISDYHTAALNPWDFESRLLNTQKDKEESPIQSAVFDESNKHFFVKDIEHPYEQADPFHWIRGYQVGGRSLTWGRQCYRLSDLDFEANLKEGIAIDWPIRYKDIEPWYSYVENFVGISGKAEGLPHLPDGEFLPPMEMNILEEHFKSKVEGAFRDRCVTIGRTANLTRGWKGRNACMYRNLCKRGCPFGGYFSSNAATIPAAEQTGNLTLRPFSIVTELLFDQDKRKATGVRILDTETMNTYEYYAKIIFLNASTIATTSILFNSCSSRFPIGFGNSSGQVGKNLMDHHSRVGAEGFFEGFEDNYYTGRRPNVVYIPRFRNLRIKEQNYLRGFGYQAYAEREPWQLKLERLKGFGKSFADKITKPGIWRMRLGGFGECLPYERNRVTLNTAKSDKWGLPLVNITFTFGANEAAMRKDMEESAKEMLSVSGFKNIKGFDYSTVGGDCIHEMGTARMGHNPKNSVLNKWNQIHEAKNVFITDGSCMTSSANQNPSLTYMALTARACNFALEQVKTGLL